MHRHHSQPGSLRLAIPGIALALSLGMGCDSGEECSASSDCETAEVCADGMCVPRSVGDAGRLDAGPVDSGPRDSGPSDAGTTDAGPRDAGTTDAGDAGAPDGGACFSCGDLNGDGNVTLGDVTALSNVLSEDRPPTSCELETGDMNGDGVLDERDAFLVGAFVFDDVTEPCADCDAICGDANGDGDVDILDVPVVLGRLEEDRTLTGCEWAALDADGNGRVDLTDARVIGRMITETVTEPCVGCANACGDANGDGDINVFDAQLVGGELANGTRSPSACELASGDTDGDGEITRRDAELIFQIVGTSGSPGIDDLCAPCERTCGDVNDDESVDGGDTTALSRILSGADTPTACDYVGADLKRDGVIDEADRQALVRFRLDPTLGACDARCELTCGDLDGSESIGLADLNRIEDHVTGATLLDDVCLLWAADVDADGDVDEADRDAVFDVVMTGGTDADLGCAE